MKCSYSKIVLITDFTTYESRIYFLVASEYFLKGSQHVEKTRESMKNRSLHAFIEENMDMSHIILAVV